MKNLIYRLRNWYELLLIRERALFVLLVWAITYALFSLIFFRPINNQRAVYADKIKEAKNQLSSLQLQIDAIDKIAESPLYLEWQQQNSVYKKMQTQYKSLLANFSNNNWHEVIKTLIANHPNVTLSHIENSEEAPFAAGNFSAQGGKIYQQSIKVIVYGDYFSTIKYLKDIEKTLPNVHWDSLKYEVVTYPTAQITLEFSVFYGKNV